MKPSERYKEIYKIVPSLMPGIKEPYHSVQALLVLLDELHPQAPEPPKPQPWAGGLPPLPPIKETK